MPLCGFSHKKVLNAKFSSGIEGDLALTLNRDFKWKQLSEIIICIFCYVFKVHLSNIDSETGEISILKKGDTEFWAWAPHFVIYDLKYNRLIQVLKDLFVSRMPNMQVLYPYYVKDHIRAMLH